MRAWDRDNDIEISDILFDKKLYKGKYKKNLLYDISYKTSTNAKPFRIRYDEIDGFIKIHNGIRYLVLFDCSSFDKICDSSNIL